MLYLALKAGLSGVIIAAVSEIARRSPTLGGLILSLPLVSILAFVWLWRETGDGERIAALSQSTFWYVLPTLPMLLLHPSAVAPRLRLLADAGRRLRTHNCALPSYRLAAGKIWHRAVKARRALN